ncbi:hypothetical protein Bbelb_088880 [Branchiostoma belcheri]|nr:hypothetical protein Bbelb_088880 [Branchiostoma belcheri]
MYIASVENKDADAVGNIDEEAMQADSTLTDDCASQSGTTNDNIPIAGASDVCDENKDANAVGNVDSGTQAMQADSTLTADGDIEPYAVATTNDHKSYFSAAGNIRQQASDDSRRDPTAHVHKLRNPPTRNLTEPQNPMYGENLQQASDDTGSDVPKARQLPKVNERKENKKCWLLTLMVTLVLTGGITYGIMARVYHNTQDIQEATSMPEVNSLSTWHAPEPTNTPILLAISSTNKPITRAVNGSTNPPTHKKCKFPFTYKDKIYYSCTKEHHDRPWCSTTVIYRGEWKNCDADDLKHRTEKVCEAEAMELACAADEQLVIDDAFYGRREKHPRCGCSVFRPCRPNCHYITSWPASISPYTFVSKSCQGLQQCEVRVDNFNFGDPCPYNLKYLELALKAAGVFG